MGKIKQDVPSELRGFAGLFDEMTYKHGDMGRVFSDFVDFWVGGMMVAGDKPLANRLEAHYGAEYGYFNKMVAEILMAYCSKIREEGDWYDGLGIFYETIASRYKSSYLGQFFTPAPVCDLMVEITSPAGKQTVNDSCCGSGRMLLAAKVVNPAGRFYGADVDPVCAKMTAINMGMHACEGEVSCINSITMEWRFGYHVNPYFGFKGILPVPHLEPIHDFEYSIFYPQKGICGIDYPIEEKVNKDKHGQLSLF
ncbi:DNA methylase, adenine-specific [Spirosomataceae bacterium]